MDNEQKTLVDRLPILDFLKSYSITTIVLYHLISFFMKGVPNYIKIASGLGGAGVHMFILCSGFGLFYSYHQNPTTFVDFIRRRFSKIYIPYIIVVLISFFIPFMYNGYNRILALLSHVLLFKMFHNNLIGSFSEPFWFISTIIQFYLIFFALIKMKQKLKSYAFFITCFLVSGIWWVAVTILNKNEIRIYNSFCLQFLWEFALGMVLAEFFIKRKINKEPKISKLILLLLSIIGLSFLGYTGIRGGILKTFNDIPSLFGYGSIAILIYNLNIRLLNNIMQYISKFSYEWYLLHILVFSCVFRLIPNTVPNFLVSILSLIASLVIALLYHETFILIKSLKK